MKLERSRPHLRNVTHSIEWLEERCLLSAAIVTQIPGRTIDGTQGRKP